MKKAMVSSMIAALGMSALLVSPSSANASVEWNFQTDWQIQYEYNGTGFSGDLSFTITSEDFNTGAVSGIDQYGAPITGTTSGNSINLQDGGVPLLIVGTVASDHTISGGVQNLFQPNLYGSFNTISGQATSYPVPEPAAYGVWAGIALVTVAAFRGTRFEYAK